MTKNASSGSAAHLAMHWWVPESSFTEGKAGSEREGVSLRPHSNPSSISSSSPLSIGPIFNYKCHKGHPLPQGQRANPACPSLGRTTLASHFHHLGHIGVLVQGAFHDLLGHL